MVEKPISMSVKDFLIRQMAVKMMITEPIIEAVVNHQYQSALEAMPKSMSIELSGFGKMYFNVGRTLRKWEKMHSKVATFTRIANDPEETEQRRKSATNKLNNTLAQIEHLKPRIDEIIASAGRMEEQADSPSQYEGADRGGEQGEDGDMREMHLPLRGEEEEAGV